MEPKSRFNLVLIGLGLLIVAFMVIRFRGSLKGNFPNKLTVVDIVASSDTSKASYKQNWDTFITASLSYNYIDEGTGNKELLVRAKNTMAYSVERVEVTVKVLSSEGKEVNRKVLIFENVPANAYKTISIPNPNTNPEYLVVATLFKVRVDAIGLSWAAE